MTLSISQNCINCDMCEPECPNEAIFLGAETYEINPNRCTECIGYYEEPACQKVCPIPNTILKNRSSEKEARSSFKIFHL